MIGVIKMGKYYDELNIGDVFNHSLKRTVTETDNLLFTTLTHNTQPLHLDEHFSKQTFYGGRIVNSLFTLSLLIGATVKDITEGTTLGNLGFQEVSFPNPVRIGDTLSFETKVVDKRLSKTRPNTGIVTFEHTCFNHRNEAVVIAKRVGLMMKKENAHSQHF